MRISNFENTKQVFRKKETHYRFRFSNTDEKLITSVPLLTLPAILLLLAFSSFFILHPLFPTSSSTRSASTRHKSHYLRIVGSSTRLRGQRDTVNFPLSLLFLIPIDSQTRPDMFSSTISRDLARLYRSPLTIIS